MRAFAYVAFTEDGAKRSGSIVAETETDAAAQLRDKGLYVSDLQARATPKPRLLQARAASLNADLQAVFTRQMAVLLGAGMTVDSALEAVRQGGHRALEIVADRARAQLLDGSSLSASLSQSGAGLPAYYLASIEAGERAGDLAGVFEELADFLEQQGQDRAVIGTALIYPAFVAAVSLLVCGILMVSVAPEIARMFALSGRPLPGITQVVMGASDWIISHRLGLGIFLAIGLVLAILSGRVPTWRAARSRLALRLPLLGRFISRAAAVQYLRTLALVLASRNTVPNAVQSAAGVLNPDTYRPDGVAVCEAIGRGESLSQALRLLPFLPPVAQQLIRAGEASARLAPMTDRAAQMVEHALVTERKRIAAILEPALMILVGALVLVIVLAVLLPIFDLQSSIG